MLTISIKSTAAVAAAGILALASAGAESLGARKKFYSDDPMWQTPKPAALPRPQDGSTKPGASTAPAGSPPSDAVKAPVSLSGSPLPSAPATPLPVRGKTP